MKKNKLLIATFIVVCSLTGLLLTSACTKSGSTIDEENQVHVPDTTQNQNPDTIQSTGSWQHPGVLNTEKTLDAIRIEIAAASVLRMEAFKKVTDYIESSAYPTSFPGTISVVASGDSEAEKQIKDNANLAYAFALRFAATSEIVWANKAIGILNGWAYAFQRYSYSGSPKDQPSLEASWAAPTFVAAAEIIRYYKPNSISANWQEADVAQFKVFLNKLKDEINKMEERGNNWWVSAGYAKMAIGVFLESKTVYEDGRKKVMSTMEGLDSYNGHDVIDPDGYPYELHNRKDDVHFQYSLTGISYAAEIDKIQGYNEIYTKKGERLSKAYDYTWRAFNEVIPAPAGVTGYDTCNLKSNVYPGIEIAYKQFGTDSQRKLRNLRQPIGNVSKLFLGFTSFTHYNLDGQSGAY